MDGDATQRFSCLICNDGSEFDSEEHLKDHVVNYHQTTFEKYQTTMAAEKSRFSVKVESAPDRDFQFVACGTDDGSGGAGDPTESLPDDWAERCTFACSACDDFTGTSTAEVNVHLNKAHPGLAESGGKGRYTMSKKVAHQCCVCDSWVPWTSLMLESHLRDKHRTSLAEYARGNAEKISEQLETLAGAASGPPRARPGAKAEAAAGASHEWFDQCTWKCKECGRQGGDVGALREHCEAVHGDPECHENLREAFYCCKVCQEVVLCSRSEIEGHLVGAHNITLAEYSHKFHRAGAESGGARAKEQKRRTPGPKSKTMLIDSDDDDQEAEPDNEPGERIVSKPKLEIKTQQQPGPKSKTLKRSEPRPSPAAVSKEASQSGKGEKDTAWRDACKFACNNCPEETATRNAMKTHCKNKHGNDGATKHYRVTVRAEHVCLLCKRPVLRESKMLTDHMHKSHKFNLLHYEEKHYYPSLKSRAPDTEPPGSDKDTKTSEKDPVPPAKSAKAKPPAAAGKPEESVKPKKIILGKTAPEKPPEPVPHRPKLTTKRKLDFSSGDKENLKESGAGVKKAADAPRPRRAERKSLPPLAAAAKVEQKPKPERRSLNPVATNTKEVEAKESSVKAGGGGREKKSSWPHSVINKTEKLQSKSARGREVSTILRRAERLFTKIVYLATNMQGERRAGDKGLYALNQETTRI